MVRLISLLDALDSPQVAEVRAQIQAFDCGDERWATPLNNYLRNGNAARDQDAFVATTYLALTEDGAELAGYVTLTWAQIDTSAALRVRAGLRRIPYPRLPALLLSRLAIQRAYQARGIGREMITWVRNLSGGLPIACRFLALHVGQDNARAISFYLRHGFFIEGSPNGNALVLMLADLRQPH